MMEEDKKGPTKNETSSPQWMAAHARLKNEWAKSAILGPRQSNLVLIAYTSSEGSGEPAHPRSLARTSAARSYKQ